MSNGSEQEIWETREKSKEGTKIMARKGFSCKPKEATVAILSKSNIKTQRHFIRSGANLTIKSMFHTIEIDIIKNITINVVITIIMV